MQVETLVKHLDEIANIKGSPGFSDWEKKFLRSVLEQIERQKPLTDRQCPHIIRLISDHKASLVGYGFSTAEVAHFVKNPVYRLKPRISHPSPTKREARFLGDNRIGLRFPFDKRLMTNLTDIVSDPAPVLSTRAVYIEKYAMWSIDITEENIDAICRFMEMFSFDVDITTWEYLDLCKKSIGRKSIAVLVPGADQIVVNVCNNPLFAIALRECFGAKIA